MKITGRITRITRYQQHLTLVVRRQWIDVPYRLLGELPWLQRGDLVHVDGTLQEHTLHATEIRILRTAKARQRAKRWLGWGWLTGRFRE